MDVSSFVSHPSSVVSRRSSFVPADPLCLCPFATFYFLLYPLTHPDSFL